MNVITIIIGLLSIILILYAHFLISKSDPLLQDDKCNPSTTFIIGLITNFFDTLGIGSFAPATALLKFTNSIDERVLPGTLNSAMAIPIMFQAIIYIDSVEVDVLTLVLLILASVIGIYVGAGFIAKLSKKYIKIIMGISLMVIAFFLILNQLNIIKSFGTGEQIGLTGIKLVIGIIIFFVLGALMAAGVGLYAPAMATVYLLGLNPIIAFPIMMGSCAFLTPVGAIKFIREKAYAPKVSINITIGGVIGVLLASNVITKLPLYLLTYLVIVVVVITAIVMLIEGVKLKSDR